MKSVKPKDGPGEPPAQGGGRNAEADFHGQKRSNDSHASTTDPDARLYRKGKGKETKLCFIGHGLMENRHSLLVDACLTLADGHAERVAALHMIEPRADRPTANLDVSVIGIIVNDDAIERGVGIPNAVSAAGTDRNFFDVEHTRQA